MKRLYHTQAHTHIHTRTCTHTHTNTQPVNELLFPRLDPPSSALPGFGEKKIFVIVGVGDCELVGGSCFLDSISALRSEMWWLSTHIL
jgi:hypothetical protein